MAHENEAELKEQPQADAEPAVKDVSDEKNEEKAPKAQKNDRKLKKLEKELQEASEKIEKLSAENAELKDNYLRKQADFDNFRKRMIRDKEDAIKFANTSLLMDIINVIDDFDRALQSVKASQDLDSFHSGVEMIEKQMLSMLETNWGLKRFESAGEAFDPEKHEALMMEESPDYDEQTVLEDFVKGYLLHDRVVRHAKVKVSKPSEKTENE